MTLVLATSLTAMSFLGFAFVDDADLIQGAEDVNTLVEELIEDFQAFMENGTVASDNWGAL